MLTQGSAFVGREPARKSIAEKRFLWVLRDANYRSTEFPGRRAVHNNAFDFTALSAQNRQSASGGAPSGSRGHSDVAYRWHAAALS